MAEGLRTRWKLIERFLKTIFKICSVAAQTESPDILFHAGLFELQSMAKVTPFLEKKECNREMIKDVRKLKTGRVCN